MKIDNMIKKYYSPDDGGAGAGGGGNPINTGSSADVGIADAFTDVGGEAAANDGTDAANNVQDETQKDEPKTEEKKSDELDLESLEFDTDPNFDPTPFESLKELGVLVDSPEFQKALSQLEQDYGIVGTENQLKALRKLREQKIKEEEMYKPENVVASLKQHLNSEEKANYKTLVNTVKAAINHEYAHVDEAKRTNLIKRVEKYALTQPVVVQLLNMVHKYYGKNGRTAEITAATAPKPREPIGTMTATQAEQEYYKLQTEALKNGKADEKSKILESLTKKVRKEDLKEWEEFLKA